jgi:hypothetical protein
MQKFHRIAFLAALLSGFGLAGTAAAQSNACVHLLVGAGYAAKMRISSGDYHTDWSGSFAIGSTKCQSLSGVPNGNKFSVEVSAILGETKTCKPSDITRVSSSTSSVTFQAWGTTLNVKCEEPGLADNADMSAAGRTVNPDGEKAASAPQK